MHAVSDLRIVAFYSSTFNMFVKEQSLQNFYDLVKTWSLMYSIFSRCGAQSIIKTMSPIKKCIHSLCCRNNVTVKIWLSHQNSRWIPDLKWRATLIKRQSPNEMYEALRPQPLLSLLMSPPRSASLSAWIWIRVFLKSVTVTFVNLKFQLTSSTVHREIFSSVISSVY